MNLKNQTDENKNVCKKTIVRRDTVHTQQVLNYEKPSEILLYKKHKISSSTECKLCSAVSGYMEILSSEGIQSPADSNSDPVEPYWMDRQVFQRGQNFFRHNFLSVFVGHLVGLIAILSELRIFQVLTFTGKSSTPSKAFKRYFSTLGHVRMWYQSDLLAPEDSGFKSIMQVRRMHTASHKNAKDAGLFAVSQYDMIVTQWAFVGPIVLFSKELGINPLGKKELFGFIHFWRVVGYLLGIEDRYNLCNGDLERVQNQCHAILHEVIRPNILSFPSGSAQPLKDSLLLASHWMVPAIDPKVFGMFTNNLLGIPVDIMGISTFRRWYFNFQNHMLGKVLHLKVFGHISRFILNQLLTFALFLLKQILVVFQWKPILLSTVESAQITVFNWFSRFTTAVFSLLHLTAIRS